MSLYDIDDLQAVVARNLDTRASEIPRAQEIVEEEIQRFARWLGQLDALPTVSALREHGDDARRAGARRERRPLGVGLAARPRARGGDRTGGHEPAAARADDPPAQPWRDRGHASLELVRELFGLSDEEPDARAAAAAAADTGEVPDNVRPLAAARAGGSGACPTRSRAMS